MIRPLKNGIKKFLGLFGLVIFKRSTGIYVGEEETPELAVRLCGKARPVVIDAGAHKGSFVHAIRRFSPEARFVCFEPDPALAGELLREFDGDARVNVVQAALGSKEGTAVLNINRSRACNSLLASQGPAAGALADLMTTMQKVEVRLTTLDEALGQIGVPVCDILKLDLQGYDLEALQGSLRILKTATVVVVEIWYAPIYADKVTYLDVCVFLQNNGFSIYSLIGLHYSTTNRLLWSDALFLRADAVQMAATVTI